MSNPQSVFVQFYTDAVEIKAESEMAGRPIFKDLPHIRKLIPGDTSNVIERVAEDQDKINHPREWDSFMRNQAVAASGTPLEQWPQITRAMVKEAKYFEVHTVEQLASLADSHCQKLGMGFYDLRNKAKAYLEAASGIAETTARAAENDRLRSEIDALKEQIKQIAAMKGGDDEEYAQPRGRGRPRKEMSE